MALSCFRALHPSSGGYLLSPERGHGSSLLRTPAFGAFLDTQKIIPSRAHPLWLSFTVKCRCSRINSQHAMLPCRITMDHFTWHSDARQLFSWTYRPRELRNPACECSSIIGELGTATLTHEWKPLLDSVLLASSIALAYLAGIITPAAPIASKAARRGKILQKKTIVDRKDCHKELDVWKEIDQEVPLQWETIFQDVCLKLVEGFNAVYLLKDESPFHRCELSLQALAEGPRLSLLLAALEWLNNEICNLKRRKRESLESDWTNMSLSMLRDSVVPVCRTWMFDEVEKNVEVKGISIEKVPFTRRGPIFSNDWQSGTKTEQEMFFSQCTSTLGLGQSFKNLNMTEKTEIYADYLYFICFGSIRYGSRCSLKTMSNRVHDILEDLIITIADGAAELYLEILAVGNTPWESQLSDAMTPQICSTRMLERFRNEVALHSWLNENFRAVNAIFEDRFDLWVLTPCKSKIGGTSSDIIPGCLSLAPSSLPVRRIKELKALSGWKYYYSIYLEFSDIIGPVLKSIVMKLGEGISFLLVILIGRSLGLIYRGIRQSVQWNSK